MAREKDNRLDIAKRIEEGGSQREQCTRESPGERDWLALQAGPGAPSDLDTSLIGDTVLFKMTLYFMFFGV